MRVLAPMAASRGNGVPAPAPAAAPAPLAGDSPVRVLAPMAATAELRADATGAGRGTNTSGARAFAIIALCIAFVVQLKSLPAAIAAAVAVSRGGRDAAARHPNASGSVDTAWAGNFPRGGRTPERGPASDFEI